MMMTPDASTVTRIEALREALELVNQAFLDDADVLLKNHGGFVRVQELRRILDEYADLVLALVYLIPFELVPRGVFRDE